MRKKSPGPSNSAIFIRPTPGQKKSGHLRVKKKSGHFERFSKVFEEILLPIDVTLRVTSIPHTFRGVWQKKSRLRRTFFFSFSVFEKKCNGKNEWGKNIRVSLMSAKKYNGICEWGKNLRVPVMLAEKYNGICEWGKNLRVPVINSKKKAISGS